jgi:hypothetical protein
MAEGDGTEGSASPGDAARDDHGQPRWFHVEVHDGAVLELSRALSGTGCLVVRDETGLRVALPGVAALDAETGIRALLKGWRFGDTAELRSIS